MVRAHVKVALLIQEATDALCAEIVSVTSNAVCADVALLVACYAREGKFRAHEPDDARESLYIWCLRGNSLLAAGSDADGKCCVWTSSRLDQRPVVATRRVQLPACATMGLVIFLERLLDGCVLVLRTPDPFCWVFHLTCDVIAEDGSLAATWRQDFSVGCWCREACLLTSASGRQELVIPEGSGLLVLDPKTGARREQLSLDGGIDRYFFSRVSDDLIFAHYRPRGPSDRRPHFTYSRASGWSAGWEFSSPFSPVIIAPLRVARFFSLGCYAGNATEWDLLTGRVLRTWCAPVECGRSASAHGNEPCPSGQGEVRVMDLETGVSYRYSKESRNVTLSAQLP